MTFVDDRPPPSEDEVSEEEEGEEGETAVVGSSTSSSAAFQKMASDQSFTTLQVDSSASSSSPSSTVAPSESVVVKESKCSVAPVEPMQKTGRGRKATKQQHQSKRRQLSAEFFEDQDQEKNPPLPLSGALKVSKLFEKYTTKIKLHRKARAAAETAAMRTGKQATVAGSTTPASHNQANKIQSVRGGNQGAATGCDTKEDSHQSKKSSQKNSKKSKKSKQTTEKSGSNKHGKAVIKLKQHTGGAAAGGGGGGGGARRPEDKSVRKPQPPPQPELQAPVEPPAKQLLFASEMQSFKANTAPRPVNTRSALPEPKVRAKGGG